MLRIASVESGGQIASSGIAGDEPEAPPVGEAALLLRQDLFDDRAGGSSVAATDEQAPRWYGGRNEVERTVAAVAEVAATRGVPPAQIALAWLLAKPGVASPLVGMSKPHHLQDALAALNLSLSPQDVAALEAPMAHAARPDRW